MVLTVNMTSENNTAAFRPKMSEGAPMKGGNTALASKYEVPVQNVSKAVPFNALASVYVHKFISFRLFNNLEWFLED